MNVLKNPNTGSRQASGNARLILKKFTFTSHQINDDTERTNMNNTNHLLTHSSTIASMNNYNTISSVDVHDFFVLNPNINPNTHSVTNSNMTQQNDDHQIKSQLSGGKSKK